MNEMAPKRKRVVPRVFEDGPGLFSSGIGTSTYGDFRCDLCGTLYNEGEDARGKYDGDSIGHTHFAGMDVCAYCFGIIELSVLERLDTLLPWLVRIFKSKRMRLDRHESALRALQEEQSNE